MSFVFLDVDDTAMHWGLMSGQLACHRDSLMPTKGSGRSHKATKDGAELSPEASFSPHNDYLQDLLASVPTTVQMYDCLTRKAMLSFKRWKLRQTETLPIRAHDALKLFSEIF